MHTLTHKNSYPIRSSSHAKPGASAINDFVTWTKLQEKNRMLWSGISVLGHGTIITILTLMVVVFNGNAIEFWALASINMAIVLVVNLAALPTKITIPVLLGSIITDITIIIAAIAGS